tara:strand:+ start:38 stop:217 length:180 start_codon:yes stop_codon:yes gene_type:complete
MVRMLFKQRKTLKDYFPKNPGTSFIFKSFIMEGNIAKPEIVMGYLVKSVPLAILTEKDQ